MNIPKKIALLVISIGILEMNGLVRLAFSVPLFAATKAEKAFGFRDIR
ncbi:hypothetical protein [Pedobacter miscanthi]|nr:hypothetical protein [Pedobacter miscanthi]